MISQIKDLIKLFKKFGKIETVRFRNVVPEDLTKPKKFAFITLVATIHFEIKS